MNAAWRLAKQNRCSIPPGGYELAEDKQDAFFSWFRLFLKDRGFQFTRCGFKGGAELGSHTINLGEGYWEKPGYSSNKPPRWLFQIDASGAIPVAQIPPAATSSNIGQANTAQGDKAGLAVRILPLIATDSGTFIKDDDFEVTGLFVFHGPVEAGSSSDTFAFDPATGAMTYKDKAQPYLLAGLLGLRDRGDAINVTAGGSSKSLTYGAVIDALAEAIQAAPIGGTPGATPIFDLTKDADLDALKQAILDAYKTAGPIAAPTIVGAADDEEETETAGGVPDIPENTDLLGIDPGVYRQINAALKSGKQHLMLYGPPGTGKTTLARWIATSLAGGKWALITGSADWSSQDIIGGYQPVGNGAVAFLPGILLQAFDRPLVIDELNRCDIDKVIGPLFTVLSGQQTTLPYRTKVEDKNSAQYVILPEPKAGAAEHEYSPSSAWRLIATINSIDKASLYQMSYALARRFGWVYVDAPRDQKTFISDFLTRFDKSAPPDGPCPLAVLWGAINKVRTIGPAPIIDAIRAIRAIEPGASFFEEASAGMREAALDAFDMVLLPMLDGVVAHDAESIADAMTTAFKLDETQAARIRRRLATMSV